MVLYGYFQQLITFFDGVKIYTALSAAPSGIAPVSKYCHSAGKKRGEFYTPSEVVQLLEALLKPHAGMRIYNLTAGSGGHVSADT